MSKEIIQYIRRGNKLIGCLYAVKFNKDDALVSIGFSLCRKTDVFDKDLGLTIAHNRALYQRLSDFPVSIKGDLLEFVNRCARYYKAKNVLICGARFAIQSVSNKGGAVCTKPS